MIAPLPCEHGCMGDERLGCACAVCIDFYGTPEERLADVIRTNVEAMTGGDDGDE